MIQNRVTSVFCCILYEVGLYALSCVISVSFYLNLPLCFAAFKMCCGRLICKIVILFKKIITVKV